MTLPTVGLNNSVHGALIESVLATVLTLELSGLPESSWYLRKRLWDTGLKDKTPCGIIALANETDDADAGAVGINEVDYYVALAMVYGSNFNIILSESDAVQLVWNERVRNRFQNRRDLVDIALPNDANLFRVRVVAPSEKFLDQAMRIGFDAQYLLLRMSVQEFADEQ